MKTVFTEYKDKIDILQILVNHRATLRINGDEFDIDGIGLLRPGDYLFHDDEQLLGVLPKGCNPYGKLVELRGV